MPTPESLQMVRLLLDPARLAAIGAELRLPLRHGDDGALIHSLLAALFGKGAIQPFQVESSRGRSGQGSRMMPVLGYTTQSEDELRVHAKSFARPHDYRACDWDAIAVKPLPAQWKPGTTLGFSVRVCPIVRLANAAEVRAHDGEVKRYGAGSEVDAWVHHRFFREDQSESREVVYANWLRRRLASAAEVPAARLHSFRRSRLVRRSHGRERKARVLERPDSILEGSLQVVDEERFNDVLRRGIGRHTAFGFGMLLLRPPEL